MSKTRTTLGIDLGTTNTAGALAGEVLSSATDAAIMPSVVAFPPSGATLVGNAAKKRRAIDPKNTISSAKRLMGQTWHGYNTTLFRKQYPFELAETSSGGCAFQTRAGAFSPADIASYVIGKLLSAHALQAGQHAAVIAVPASFDAAAVNATLGAARQAGLTEVTTVAEPVATALAYLSRDAGKYRRVAVYDFGGGTFDLAILDTANKPARVIAHGGDAYLGGDDLDKALTDWVADQVLEQHNWDLRSNPEVLDRLTVQCERAKIRLCVAQQTRIELAQVDPGSPAAARAVSLDRATLQRLSAPFVSRTFLICDQVLREAGVRAGDIDAVFLAGGTTLLPTIREGVSHYFGAPCHSEFDPMEVVSLGASLFSA